MTTRYDPTVIQEFAIRLYKRAETIVYFYGLIGTLVGLGAGSMLAFTLNTSGMLALGGAIVGGGLAAFGALERAFALRLQAQTALCQLQIEFNTRPRETVDAARYPAA